jgi:hypothetical protein
MGEGGYARDEEVELMKFLKETRSHLLPGHFEQ